MGLGAWASAAGNGAAPGLSMVSTDAGGMPLEFANSRSVVSGDGRFVAMVTRRHSVVVKDTRSGDLREVCPNCSEPALSHDGRHVAFSTVRRLAPGDRKGALDVYVKDLRSGSTRLVSGGSALTREGGAYAPSISADGRRVAFLTADDRRRKAKAWVTDESDSVTFVGRRAFDPQLSADGYTVVFASKAYDALSPEGADGTRHVLIRDLRTGRLTSLATRVRLGVTSDFYAIEHSTPSADGSRLAITLRSDHRGTNPEWSGLYVVDLRAGTVIHRLRNRDGRVTYGDAPKLSADGQHLLFNSADDKLVRGDLSRGSDVFVTDLRTGVTRMITSPRHLKFDGFQYPLSSHATAAAISADGATAVFYSSDEQRVSQRNPTPGYRFGGLYLSRAPESGS